MHFRSALFNLLKNTNRKTIKKISHRRKPYRMNFWYWVSASCAAVFLLILGINHLYKLHTYNEIYYEYFNEKEYSSDSNASDFRGTTHLQPTIEEALATWFNGDKTQAIDTLEEIVNQGDINPDYQDACWYAALFYIKEHKIQKAVTILKAIENEKGYYADRAASILKKLE